MQQLQSLPNIAELRARRDRTVLQMLREGATQRELAVRMGVTQQAVSRMAARARRGGGDVPAALDGAVSA